MRIHRPTSLVYLPAESGTGLVRLSGIEGLTRSLLVGTVPLIALERLGSKAAVSQAYTGGAILALIVTLNIARLEQVTARRWVMTFGIVSLFTAGVLLTIDNVTAFVLAIGFRSIAATTFSVVLTLYVMDFIGKSELTRVESNRLAINGAAWLIGPSLGLWMSSNIDPAAPFLLSAALSIVLLSYYWWLRLGHSEVITAPKSAAVSPLTSIPRFFSQKYMRIAYTITFVRATFWVALFVYAPIYVVEAGYDEWVAGAFLSGVAGFLLAAPAVRVVADQTGTRRVVISSFVLIGTALLGLTVIGEPRGIGIVLWVMAAIGASAIDVVGNIPFMRMVKPRERTAMATVFSTWRDTSSLLAPLIAVVVLGVGLPFAAFFAVLACMSFVAAAVTLPLPRRL